MKFSPPFVFVAIAALPLVTGKGWAGLPRRNVGFATPHRSAVPCHPKRRIEPSTGTNGLFRGLFIDRFAKRKKFRAASRIARENTSHKLHDHNRAAFNAGFKDGYNRKNRIKARDHFLGHRDAYPIGFALGFALVFPFLFSPFGFLESGFMFGSILLSICGLLFSLLIPFWILLFPMGFLFFPMLITWSKLEDTRDQSNAFDVGYSAGVEASKNVDSSPRDL